jgi:hypothetical protein
VLVVVIAGDFCKAVVLVLHQLYFVFHGVEQVSVKEQGI